MSITTPHRSAVTLAVTALLLTGCRLPFSEESRFLERSSREMAEVAFAEMRDLKSVRMLGSVRLKDHGTTRVDMQLDEQGNCTGSFDTEFGGMQMRKNEEGAWFQVDENYVWTHSSSAQEATRMRALVGRKWMSPAQETDVEGLCDFDKMMGDFELTKQDTDASLVKGETEQIGEQEAVRIEGDSGKSRTAVWVSLTAPHRVVKMAPADDVHEQEVLFFDDFDAQFVVETPAKKDRVTVSKLGR